MSLTSTEKKDNNIVELEIALGAGEVAAAVDKVYKQKAKTITVPGFRKGKAPRTIIEKMYGEGIFLEDAFNSLYPDAYNDAVEEAGITPVDRADIEVLSLDQQEGIRFKASVTVKPEISVKDYRGIEATKTVRKVTEADIDGEIEAMRNRNARILTVEDGVAEMNDIVTVDFDGSMDGVPFAGGQGKDFTLTLGSRSFIDTFEEQIAGHKVGEVFDVNVTFPEDYQAEELAGKPALFQVTLKIVQKKELPELDDEFVKDVSEFDTVDELKADLWKKHEEINENQAQETLENYLVDEIIKTVEGDIPECMYTNKIEEMVADFQYRLSMQGMTLQIYLQYTGMDEEAFRSSFRPQAERQVKIRLALEKIAELENLEVSPEDIEEEYKKLAERYEAELDEIKKMMPEKEMLLDVKAGKAIDIIRDSAKVTIVEIDPSQEAEQQTAEPEEKPAKKTKAKKDEESSTEEAPKKPAARKRTATKKTEESKDDSKSEADSDKEKNE